MGASPISSAGERMPVVPVIMIYPDDEGSTVEIDGNIFHHSSNVRVAIGNVDWNSAKFTQKGGTVDVHANISRSHKKRITWNIKKSMPNPLKEWLMSVADKELGQPKGA